MDTKLCRKFGIEFPLFAFSHCRDVVAEVTKAGGVGVLGAVGQTAESLEEDLHWIDQRTEGMPYGVDLLIPNKIEDKEGVLTEQLLEARIPQSQRSYLESLIAKYGIDSTDLWSGKYGGNNYSKNLLESGANELLDVALEHNISLFVNALGVPPASTIERCRAQGVMVGALTGAKEHALKHAEAGVEILVVSGTEAGGHCGEISTMVVVPEVINVMKEYPGMHVLAAGGIATGRQMAACMAMGADGVWCGSVWLTTTEAETTPTVKAKMLSASSRDTVRSTTRTGKPTRQLRSAWTEEWKTPSAPSPLPMPLQGMLSRPVLDKIDRLAANGHEGAKELATYYVGQAVGLMNSEQNVKSVVREFMSEYADSVQALVKTLD